MSTKPDAASAMASPITPCDLQPLPRAVTRPVTRHDEKILVEEFIKNYHPEDFWGATAQQHAEEPQPKPRRGICGIPPKIFWLLVAVLLIATAAAIGGGVGGAMSTKGDHYDQKRSVPRHDGPVSFLRPGARHLRHVLPPAP